MERSKKPAAIPVSPTGPSPIVSLSDDNARVVATLPSGDRLEVLLYGATVISWRGPNGKENLFLSEKAYLDGSKAVRGGIPVVFPLFGPPQPGHETSKLPQHGFARTSRWEYLGKTSSESSSVPSTGGDSSVKLDFGLSDSVIDAATRQAWDHSFGLTYSITLSTGEISTSLAISNTGSTPWEFQTLFHTYLKINDISRTTVKGLEATPFIDKVGPSAPSFTEAANEPITFSGEVDRVYTNNTAPITVMEGSETLFEVVRDDMNDVVIWNPWTEKSKGMSDFGPADGWKQMLCVEAGAVGGWQKLDGGEAWEGGQRIKMG